MKFRSVMFVVIASTVAMASLPAFALDEQPKQQSQVDQLKQAAIDAGAKALKEQIQTVNQANNQVTTNPAQSPTKPDSNLDSSLASALKVTQDRASQLSDDEKKKLIDDLNHPDGKTIGQGMAAFGKEIGQGFGSAVKEVGTTFNDFANSGVGKITAAIIVWKLFGHQFLWFIFIIMLLTGLGRTLRYICGEYNATTGKFVKYDLTVFSKLDDGVVFGIFLLVLCIVAAIIIGAAVNL